MIKTIGHSNHPIGRFVDLLKAGGVEAVVDVRSTPYSRRFPQFGRERLAQSLSAAGILYRYEGAALGGKLTMRIIALLLVAIVMLSHLGFLVLEMFLWTDPVGYRIFGTTPEFAAQSAVLAANQGLYNGFLAAGLLWGLISGRRDVKAF